MQLSKTKELEEQTEFINQQLENNKESEYAIKQLNHEVAAIRIQLHQCNEAIQLHTNEYITMKRQLQHETNLVQQIRQKNRQMTIECEIKTKDIEKMKAIVTDLIEKMAKIKSQKNSAEARLRHLDELYDHEQKSVHNVNAETARLSQMLFRSSQVLGQWREEQKLAEVMYRELLSFYQNI